MRVGPRVTIIERRPVKRLYFSRSCQRPQGLQNLSRPSEPVPHMAVLEQQSAQIRTPGIAPPKNVSASTAANATPSNRSSRKKSRSSGGNVPNILIEYDSLKNIDRPLPLGSMSKFKIQNRKSKFCNACGNCCDFDAYGHRLYITPPELMYLADKIGKENLKPMTGWPLPVSG